MKRSRNVICRLILPIFVWVSAGSPLIAPREAFTAEPTAAESDAVPPVERLTPIVRFGSARLAAMGNVYHVSLSPDGKTLAAAMDNAESPSQVRVFDLQDGKLLHSPLPAHAGSLLMFSGDGSKLYVGGACWETKDWAQTSPAPAAAVAATVRRRPMGHCRRSDARQTRGAATQRPDARGRQPWGVEAQRRHTFRYHSTFRDPATRPGVGRFARRQSSRDWEGRWVVGITLAAAWRASAQRATFGRQPAPWHIAGGRSRSSAERGVFTRRQIVGSGRRPGRRRSDRRS